MFPIFGNTHVEYFKNNDLPTEGVFFENTRTQKVGVAKNAREGGGEDVWSLDGWMLKSLGCNLMTHHRTLKHIQTHPVTPHI